MSFTFFGMEYFCFGVGSCVGEFFEYRSRIEEFWVKFLGSLETSTDDEDFSGYISIVNSEYTGDYLDAGGLVASTLVNS